MKRTKIIDFIRKRKAAAGAVIFFAISISGFFLTGEIIRLENKKLHVFSQTVQIEKEDNPLHSAPPAKKSRCTLEMKIPLRSDGVLNCWFHNNKSWGSQYDIYIQNNTKNEMKDWVLELSVPTNARIDSCWNGSYKIKNGKITVTPSKEALNDRIFPEGFCKLGFVLYTNTLLTESDFFFQTRIEKQVLKDGRFIFFEVLSILGFFLLALILSNGLILKKQKQQAEKELSEVLRLCARFIDTRDSYTKQHSLNVAKYSMLLSKELGFNSDFQKNIYNCGLLHDVGKVMISRDILCKNSKLTDEEWNGEMKNHTVYGAEILKDLTAIKNVQKVALYHHERYDGNGYMMGLKGGEIPLEARIVCVADSFDAMATDRVYRPHLSMEDIVQELEKGKGRQFDPEIADAMLSLIEKGIISIK